MLRSFIYVCSAVAFLLFVASGYSLAADGGYSGLFAAPSKNNSSANKDSSYSGLVAPAEDSRSRRQEPQGYGGLIGGQTEEPKPFVNPYAKLREEAREAKEEEVQERFTPIPNAESNFAPQTAESLKRYNYIKKASENIKKTIGTMRFSKEQLKELAKPRTKMLGMYPAELMATTQVSELLKKVKNTTTEDGLRGYEARKAIKTLVNLADSFRLQLSAPEGAFRDMNLPESYIREEKIAKRRALKVVNSGIKKVKEYY